MNVNLSQEVKVRRDISSLDQSKLPWPSHHKVWNLISLTTNSALYCKNCGGRGKNATASSISWNVGVVLCLYDYDHDRVVHKSNKVNICCWFVSVWGLCVKYLTSFFAWCEARNIAEGPHDADCTALFCISCPLVTVHLMSPYCLKFTFLDILFASPPQYIRLYKVGEDGHILYVKCRLFCSTVLYDCGACAAHHYNAVLFCNIC